MDLTKLNRNVSLNCPTCGTNFFNSSHSSDVDIQVIECANCGRKLFKDDLIRENAGAIDENIKEIGKLASKEIGNELKKMFKKIKLRL